MSEICERLHRICQSSRVFGFPFNPGELPNNGIYILVEIGELAHGTQRIVRVGTHTGLNQLPSRLKQHFLKENKDRSIFRKNIGRAFLNRDGDPFLEYWQRDLTTRQAREEYAGAVDPARQKAIEKQVTEYIRQQFRFVVLPVEDKEKRLELESGIISSVSLCDECRPSERWLGNHSPVSKIRQSGLWLVNELYRSPLSRKDLDEIQDVILS